MNRTKLHNRSVRAPRRAQRTCLRCGEVFWSEGPGNRMCLVCISRTKDEADALADPWIGGLPIREIPTRR